MIRNHITALYEVSVGVKFLRYLFPVFGLTISLFVLAIFVPLGFCGFSDCLGAGRPTMMHRLTGALMIAAALIPFATSAWLIFALKDQERIGQFAAMLVWCVALVFGGLGVFQIIADPGDAHWAGLPLIAYSFSTAVTLLTLRYDSRSH